MLNNGQSDTKAANTVGQVLLSFHSPMQTYLQVKFDSLDSGKKMILCAVHRLQLAKSSKRLLPYSDF